MELAKKRSESPFSKTKGRGQETDTADNVGEIVEPTKTKKKGHRNKQKSQVNGKENGGSASRKNDIGKEQIEDKSKQCSENNKEKCEQINVTMSDLKENVLNNSCEPVEPQPESSDIKDQNNDQNIVKDQAPESANIVETNAVSGAVVNEINAEENDKENCTSTDLFVTQCNDKNVIPLPYKTDLSQSQMSQNESLNNKSAIDVNGVSVSSVNCQNSPEITSLEESDIHVNGSNDDSYFEAVDFGKDDDIQASPDTATQDDNSISNKITSFLARHAATSSPLQEQKGDSEISSSKNLMNSMNLTTDGKPITHPYLSKVTGRPGIRERSNLSSLDTNGLDGAETPINKGNNLSDSFRVKTDPPRLNQFDYKENPVLRKFKGKRCLNVNDDYDEGDGMYVTMTKRRKLDDKTSGSGFLGSMLWSPFKKRPINVENSLNITANQSKLSRFLSPFWFWKKAATATNHHE